MIAIVPDPINVLQVVESVIDPAAGAIDIFIGTSRNISHGKKVLYLEYEAYLPMATEFLDRIAATASERWGTRKISIVHRTGRVGLGESSVVVAVSAAHRREAFEACRYIIDTLKEDVPIWKKEHFEDGEVWAGREGSTITPE